MSLASYLFLFTVALPLYLLVGAHLQVLAEDLLWNLIGG
jgi:hypothetical protein